jgi:hypothetical protein
MGEHDTMLNAVIGAAVAIFASFVPFSTLVGGAVAGYLEGGTSSDGFRVGAISGGIQMLLVIVMGAIFLVFFSAVLASAGGSELIGVGILFFLVAIVVAAVYTVGLSALGGWLGNELR